MDIKRNIGFLFVAYCILATDSRAAEIDKSILDKEFVDHGTPVQVSEARGVVASCDSNGRPIILAVAWGFCDGGSRSSLLIIDALTGATEQYYYPDEKSVNASSYGFALSNDKKFFYTMFANYFLEFDIANRKWTYVKKIEEGAALAYTIAPDGTIYGGLLPVYTSAKPVARLFSFNPKTREFTNCGMLDEKEEQPWSLAADKSGWVYAGIGPARSNLVAYDPKTKKMTQLLKESERKPGVGSVYPGVDGKVYAQSWVSEAFGAMAGPGANPKTNKGQWYQLFEGSATPLAEAPTVARSPIKAYHWGTLFQDFPDGRNIVAFNLPESWVDIQDTDKKIRRVTFNYRQEGAAITALINGPDGKVYGTTCHPMHFFAYDPQKNFLQDFGGLDRVAGGSFAEWKFRGNQLFSAAYSDGWLYSCDLAKPWNGEKGENPNPRFLGQYPDDLGCPQATLLHPDGHNMIFTGFPGYGIVGGGMVIYDLDTDKSTLIPNKDIISGQSTTALKALPNGDLIAGTGPSGAHGGHATAKEALIYIMDWKTKKVTFSMAPAKGSNAVNDIAVTPDGLVHGVAGATYFVFDPVKKVIVHSQDMSEFGILGSWYAARTLFLASDGNIYGLFRKAILKIEPKTFKIEKLFTLPPSMEGSWGTGVTGGMVLQGDRLYFSASTNVYSCPVKGFAKKAVPREIGPIQLLSDSDRDKTIFAFQNIADAIEHTHYDENSFVVNVAGSWIITDSQNRDGRYVPGENAVKTINHNTILVDGRGQDKLGKGQRKELFYSPHFDYVAADACKSYPQGTLNKFLRHIFYVRPDYFLIFDEIESPAASKFTWLLNTDSNGVMDLKSVVISLKRGKTSLDAFMLKPDKADVQIAKGQYGTCASVSNQEKAKEMNFLALICPETKDANVQRIEDKGLVGAEIKDEFGTSRILISLAGNSDALRYQQQTFCGENSFISFSTKGRVEKYALIKGTLLTHKDKVLVSCKNGCSLSLGWKGMLAKGTLELRKESEVTMYLPNLKRLSLNNSMADYKNTYDSETGMLKVQLKEGIYNIAADLK